jgi:hypothetical protein
MSNKKDKAALYIIPVVVIAVLYFYYSKGFTRTAPFSLTNGLIGGGVAIYTQVVLSKLAIWLDKNSKTVTESISSGILFFIITLCVIVLGYLLIILVFNLIYPAGPGQSASVALFGSFLAGFAGISLGLVNHLENRTKE